MIDFATLPAEVRQLIEVQAATIEALRMQIARLRRMQFGRSSEKVASEIDQLTLALEELESGLARTTVSIETPCTAIKPEVERPARRPLPEHLPRVAVTHAAPGSAACACPSCGGTLSRLGEDVTEVLDYVRRRSG